MIGTAGLPHVIVRFFTVKKVSDARKSAGWALLFIAILYTTAPAISVFARTNLIDTVSEKKYEEMPVWFDNWEKTGLLKFEDKNDDGIIQYVADPQINELTIDRDIMVMANPEIAELPNWVIALLAAGALAAALSTAAGLLLVISSSVSHDLIKKIIKPDVSEKGELIAARISAFFAVIMAGYFGINPPGFVAAVVALAFGLAAASFFPAIVMGIFYKRMNKEGEYITPLPLKGRRYAQLTNSESDISKDYPVDFTVIGDARPSIAEMNAEVKVRLGDEGRRAEDSVRKELAALKAAFLDEWRPLLECNERPISPYRVVWDLMHCVDRTRTVVTHEAGSPRDQITPFYEAIVPHGYIGWGKTTQLGTSLGLIQGAKLARPDWHAVNIMGESAMGMVGMDFETSVRNRIGTTTIVLRNGVMGNYTNFHPVASEKYAINELGGNYADLASALGGYAERIEDPAEIKPAIKRALARNDEGEPALLEFITAEENRKATRLPDDITYRKQYG